MRHVMYLAVLAGCSGNLPAASFIDKLRVLAVQTEPPEVAPFETSALSALVVEPPVQQLDGGPPSPVSYLWTACKIPLGASALTPCGLGTDALSAGLPPSCAAQPGADLCVIGTDPTASFAPSDAAVGSDGTGQWLISLTVSDTAGGAVGCLMDAFANQGQVQSPDHCVLALKRLAISVPGHRLSDGSAAPAPNRNPLLTGFTLDQPDASSASLLDDSAVFATQPTSNPKAFALHATRSDDSAEVYPVFDNAGHRSDVYEALALSWFITAGKLAAGRGAYNPASCATQADCPTLLPVTEAHVDWTPPTDAELAGHSTDGSVLIWAVLRDDRGGVTWRAGHARRAR